LQFFLAEAGDIIITRTPAGVMLGKAGMEIPQAADVVWLGIDGLGRSSKPIVRVKVGSTLAS
jgi:2-keto-4-pentenoate hydratase/2-oxohepta-3-ene-1,7-dioic acid hydratase in catechol pathway